MIVRGIPIRLVTKAWPLVEDWVRAALQEASADHSPEQIRALLDDGRAQLWLAWDGSKAHGCCITELIESVRGKACNIVVVAGLDFKSWRALTTDIAEWARGEGCVRMEAAGRRGWERLVKADGWRKLRTVIEVDLRNGIIEADHDDQRLRRPLGAGAGRPQGCHPRDPGPVCEGQGRHTGADGERLPQGSAQRPVP